MSNTELSITIILALVAIAWAPGTAMKGLSTAYWWQAKEYRRDRMLVHQQTPEGRKLFRARSAYFLLFYGVGLPSLLFLTLLLLGAGGAAIWAHIGPYVEIMLLLASLCVGYLFVRAGVGALLAGQQRRLLWPRWTTRARIAFGFPLVLWITYGLVPMIFLILPASATHINTAQSEGWVSLLALLYTPLSISTLLLGSFLLGYLAFLAMLSYFVPLLMQLGVWITASLSLIQERRTLAEAKHHLARFSHLKTIGITGSYGKTSTKEFLATLLVEQFVVAKTPDNNNTAIGLARAVVAQITPETELFVGEYGAYRQGEIRAMTEVLRPQIAVITAISPQHLELFRTLENTIKAKYELVQALPVGGLAIFNADNENVREMAKWFKGQKRFYSLKGRIQVSGERCAYLAMDIKQTAKSLTFTLVDNRQDKAVKQEVSLDLRGAQHVGNFLAAAAVASELGLALTEIARRAKHITPLLGNMFPLEGNDGVYLIDDSYSANPDGFIAALDYLSCVKKGRKFVVARSMQELGSEATAAHRSVGEKMAKQADWFILLDRNHEDDYRAGIGRDKKGKTQVKIAETPAAAIQFLQSEVQRGDTVLLEGRMPKGIIDSLKLKA